MENQRKHYKRSNLSDDFSPETALKRLEEHREQYIREWGEDRYNQLRKEVETDVALRNESSRVASEPDART